MLCEVRLRLVKALGVRLLRGPTIPVVASDENREFGPWELAFDMFTGVCELFQPGSVTFFESNASGSQKGMKQEVSSA